LRGGSFKVGQTVGVWPGMITGKVRTLQSNGQDVEEAVPGQRTAISLTGVNRERLVRGGVITARTDLNYFHRHPVLALSVEMLHNAPVSIFDRRRGLLITGTCEIEGEIRLYDRKELKPAESGLLFFKPDNPSYALVGDHYILRLPTPMVTLGGGTVLDHLQAFPRRKQLPDLEYLRERSRPDLESVLLSELRKSVLVRSSELLQNADFGAKEVDAKVDLLIDIGHYAIGHQLLNHIYWTRLNSVRKVSDRESFWNLDEVLAVLAHITPPAPSRGSSELPA